MYVPTGEHYDVICARPAVCQNYMAVTLLRLILLPDQKHRN